MPATLDPRGVRFTAAITSVILAVGLVTGSWRVLAAQTVLFALCAFIGMGLNPWGAMFRSAVAPRLQPVPEQEPARVRWPDLPCSGRCTSSDRGRASRFAGTGTDSA